MAKINPPTQTYCIYFVADNDGSDNPVDFDISDINGRSYQEIGNSELRQSCDDITRVDVYAIPASLKWNMSRDIDLDQLGECMHTSTREDLS